MSDLPNFKELRYDPDHHLGLGDVRLTIAQQDAIDAKIERLRAALQKIANHNDGELLTREADDMANIARAALDTVDEKGQDHD